MVKAVALACLLQACLLGSALAGRQVSNLSRARRRATYHGEASLGSDPCIASPKIPWAASHRFASGLHTLGLPCMHWGLPSPP
jgi:hypothetical protein